MDNIARDIHWANDGLNAVVLDAERNSRAVAEFTEYDYNLRVRIKELSEMLHLPYIEVTEIERQVTGDEGVINQEQQQFGGDAQDAVLRAKETAAQMADDNISEAVRQMESAEQRTIEYEQRINEYIQAYIQAQEEARLAREAADNVMKENLAALAQKQQEYAEIKARELEARSVHDANAAWTARDAEDARAEAQAAEEKAFAAYEAAVQADADKAKAGAAGQAGDGSKAAADGRAQSGIGDEDAVKLELEFVHSEYLEQMKRMDEAKAALYAPKDKTGVDKSLDELRIAYAEQIKRMEEDRIAFYKSLSRKSEFSDTVAIGKTKLLPDGSIIRPDGIMVRPNGVMLRPKVVLTNSQERELRRASAAERILPNGGSGDSLEESIRKLEESVIGV
jgi:hypothetical protein